MATPVYPADLIDANGQTRAGNMITFPNGLVTPNAILGPFTFAFNAAALTAGVALFTPPVGMVIYDVGISVPVAFNGTTPLADIGTFNGGNAGLFQELNSAAVDLTTADAAVADNAGIAQVAADGWLSALNGTVGLVVTAANPLLLVVSQDGTKGGTATGATAGSLNVYIVAASPAGS